jgi:hypothetical protein
MRSAFTRRFAILCAALLCGVVNAATVFDDFSSYTPPQEPTAWTKVNYEVGVTDWTIPTADDSGNVIARDQANAQASRVHFLVHTATGVQSGAGQTLEVVLKWRFRTGETPGPDLHAILLAQSVDATDLGAYVFGPNSTTQCRAFIRASPGGGTGTLGGTTDVSIGFTLVADTWYWTRFKRETNGIFRGRIWADGSGEPGTWQWESGTANTTFTSGYVGIGGNSSGAEQDFDVIGIGLGESAPTSAGGGGGSGLLLRRRRAANDDTFYQQPLRAVGF